MKLYDYFRSSCAYRVRIALAIKNLDYSAIQVNLTQNAQHAPDYLTINPQGLVPTVVDGDLILSQSLAIIEYLNEKYPTPPLLPYAIEKRAEVRALAYLIACDIHPLNNLRVLNTLRRDWQASPEQITQWYQHWVAKGFSTIEARLAKYPRKQLFCCAEMITMADICLVPQVYNAKRFECRLDAYPIIQSVYEHCIKLPEFVAAAPRNHDAT